MCNKMSILELVLLFIVIIIIVIIAVLNAIAASRLTGIKNYDSDSVLNRAHEFLTWSSVLGWIGLFFLVGLMAYYFSKDSIQRESVSKGTGVRVLLFITTIFIFIVGILSASAAVEMDKTTTNKKELDESGARGLTNWAAILGIVGAVLVVVALVASYYVKVRAVKKKDPKTGKSKLSDEEEMEDFNL